MSGARDDGIYQKRKKPRAHHFRIFGKNQTHGLLLEGGSLHMQRWWNQVGGGIYCLCGDGEYVGYVFEGAWMIPMLFVIGRRLLPTLPPPHQNHLQKVEPRVNSAAPQWPQQRDPKDPGFPLQKQRQRHHRQAQGSRPSRRNLLVRILSPTDFLGEKIHSPSSGTFCSRVYQFCIGCWESHEVQICISSFFQRREGCCF